MNLNVKRQIADLRKMPAAMLREKHQEVFGEPSRSGHRECLFLRKLQRPRRGRRRVRTWVNLGRKWIGQGRLSYSICQMARPLGRSVSRTPRGPYRRAQPAVFCGSRDQHLSPMPRWRWGRAALP